MQFKSGRNLKTIGTAEDAQVKSLCFLFGKTQIKVSRLFCCAVKLGGQMPDVFSEIFKPLPELIKELEEYPEDANRDPRDCKPKHPDNK